MADLPSKPAPISGYRSRAINAVSDFADAMRPVAGPGIHIASGAGGKIVSLDRRAVGRLPRPWSCSIVPTTATGYPGRITWMVRVWLGEVIDVADASSLAFGDTTPDSTDVTLATYTAANAVTDTLTGLTYVDVEPPASSSWLVAARSSTGYSLAWAQTPCIVYGGIIDAEPLAYAAITVDGPSVRELLPGLIRLGARGGNGSGLLPFDIVQLASGYAVYIGVGLADAAVQANNDAGVSCASTIDADGYIALTVPSATLTPVHLWVGANLSTGAYYWGVSTTYPQDTATYRYAAIWPIGQIDSDGVITQYWHGAIRIVDTACDDLSIERGGGDDGQMFQLLDFADGTNTSATISTIDFPYRAAYGNGYKLYYLNGGELVSEIVSIVLSEIIDDIYSHGQIYTGLAGIFQPLVTTETTTDGLDSGEYHGILKDANGKTWAPAAT